MTRKNRYIDKVAFVTGATMGLGLAILEGLLDEGAKVVGVARHIEPLQEKYADNKNVLALVCDVRDKKSVDTAVNKAVEHFGRIDVVFSNAGIIGRQSLLNSTQEQWLDVINTNLNGMFYVNQATLKVMVDQGIKGAVVNTSSMASRCVSPKTGAYSASKGGVSMLTKFAALEMAQYGIRVNAIAPGTHITRITEGTRFDPERNKAFLNNIPMGRYGEPYEAADAALYLGSDEASYITGEILLEDGGFCLF